MQLRDVAGPELHDVPVRIRHIGSPRVAEVVLEDVEPASPKAFDGAGVVLLGDVHRVMDMDAATAARHAHLRLPEPDPGPVTCQQPHRVPMLPALDDGETEQLRVEMLGSIEIDDLEHELVDSGDGDAVAQKISGHHGARSVRKRASARATAPSASSTLPDRSSWANVKPP